MSDVIAFMFGGRESNVRLQLPFVHRILDEHPEVEYHLWNLSRTSEDSEYLNSLADGRLVVRNDFYGDGNPWKHFNDVWKHYAAPEYADKLFVKLDDDVVFIETERFGDFLSAIEDNRNSVISANVVNNGACMPLTPLLYRAFRRTHTALLDVHLRSSYAEMAHNYFFDHTAEMLDQDIELVPSENWLSINLIGYDSAMAVQIAERLGKPSPRHIAGRNFFRANSRLGDEGRVNMLPRKILKGFTAGHLTFGPQEKALRDDQLDVLRKQYREIGQEYLSR